MKTASFACNKAWAYFSQGDNGFRSPVGTLAKAASNFSARLGFARFGTTIAGTPSSVGD